MTPLKCEESSIRNINWIIMSAAAFMPPLKTHSEELPLSKQTLSIDIVWSLGSVNSSNGLKVRVDNSTATLVAKTFWQPLTYFQINVILWTILLPKRLPTKSNSLKYEKPHYSPNIQHWSKISDQKRTTVKLENIRRKVGGGGGWLHLFLLILMGRMCDRSPSVRSSAVRSVCPSVRSSVCSSDDVRADAALAVLVAIIVALILVD